ncbi:MAG: hypothetical protein R3F11_23050 [Verrucomicrobiales bacterium]
MGTSGAVVERGWSAFGVRRVAVADRRGQIGFGLRFRPRVPRRVP